jgi:hypothetical protein
MVSISGAFPSKYIAATDLQGRDVPVTISHVSMEVVGSQGNQETLPVVYFMGKEKGLVLNKTNANTIAQLHGDDTDFWANRPVTLFPTQTDFQGRQVPCIRVRLATSAPAPAPAHAGNGRPPQNHPVAPDGPPPGHPAAMGAGPIDDEIPF